MKVPVLTGLFLFAWLAILPASGVGRAAVRPMVVWVDGQAMRFSALVDTPRQALGEAGKDLGPGDLILHAGRPLDPDGRIPDADPLVLQVQRAIQIDIPDTEMTVYSAAPTLAQVFWEAGFQLRVSDILVPEPEAVPSADVLIEWQPSEAITIEIGNRSYHSRSAYGRVGPALQEAGLSIQGLDFSLPGVDQSIPSNGHIEIVRVREEIILEQESLPFETLFQPAPDVEIDQKQVVQVGAFGLKLQRVRVRYENGEEVSRAVEAEWTASEPKARIIGYGTKIVLRTVDTPQGPLEYWRAVPAYATSYSPCRLGTEFCGGTTASGLPLEKGVVGVIRSWYNAMVFSQVYVEGYGVGTIADIGAGLSGQHWIDLGYSDDDWQQWAGQVTIYFLAPVPPADQILWVLP